jgi:RNA polymerase sigma-70 factor, ECF subfamily
MHMEDAGLHDDDATLVARCLDGRRQSFSVLVDRYQVVLFNLTLRMVGNEEDARDLTQSVFLKIFENLNTYDPGFKFFSWIYKIAMNESLNFLKRKKPESSLTGDLVDSRGLPGKDYEDAQLEEQIQAAMMNLSPEYREVLVLRHFQNFSYREIGEAIGIAEKTVKSRLFTARRQMASILSKEGVVG